MRFCSTDVIERIGYDFYCDIANNIVKGRKATGLTQRELAEKTGIKERKKMLASQAEVSEHERCYHYILDKISMNGQRFDSSVNVEQWGIIEQGYAIMYVQAARDLCASGGFSYKAFMNWADKNALLQTDGKNQTKLKKIERKTVRCVWIKLDESKDADGFERVAQEELPFK